MSKRKSTKKPRKINRFKQTAIGRLQVAVDVAKPKNPQQISKVKKDKLLKKFKTHLMYQGLDSNQAQQVLKDAGLTRSFKKVSTFKAKIDNFVKNADKSFNIRKGRFNGLMLFGRLPKWVYETKKFDVKTALNKLGPDYDRLDLDDATTFSEAKIKKFKAVLSEYGVNSEEDFEHLLAEEYSDWWERTRDALIRALPELSLYDSLEITHFIRNIIVPTFKK